MPKIVSIEPWDPGIIDRWGEKNPTGLMRKFMEFYKLDDEYCDWEEEEFQIALMEDFIKQYCDPQDWIRYVRSEAIEYVDNREENEVDEDEEE